MNNNKPRLIVFADDWGRHPSSAQHLARKLQNRYRIDWVNILGTRRPELKMLDVGRGLKALQRCFLPARQRHAAHAGPSGTDHGVHVHNPLHWPGFGRSLERALNAGLLERSLRSVLFRGARPAAVITTHPLVADVVEKSQNLNWVYYIVDNLSVWPGLDGKTLQEMEEKMLPLVSRVVAASEVLQRYVSDKGYEAQLLTHGTDLDLWAGVRRRPVRDEGARPVAVYWGHADARLDTAICLAVAERCDLYMIGPRRGVDERLIFSRNIKWRDAVAYEALPQIAEFADVLVMPYTKAPVTEAMQPLKLKEYLATPLPVVATHLPSTEQWKDALDLADDPDTFAELCVRRAGQDLLPEQELARRRLKSEAWEVKAAMFESLIGLDQARAPAQ